MITGDKVKIVMHGAAVGSFWHNGKFFELSEVMDKTFTVGEADDQTCYIVELKHRFARWMLVKV